MTRTPKSAGDETPPSRRSLAAVVTEGQAHVDLPPHRVEAAAGLQAAPGQQPRKHDPDPTGEVRRTSAKWNLVTKLLPPLKTSGWSGG